MAKKLFRIRGTLAEALGDTVNSAKNNAGELHVEIIPLRKIELDPDNPRDLLLSFEDLYQGISKKDNAFERKTTEKEALHSLTSSIKDQGVINPIVVYKCNDQYRLIAGERRTLASILAEKSDIPARVLTTRPDQLKLSLLQWIENIEREDLTLWERLRNLEKILNAFADTKEKKASEISPTELSQLLGCSLQQGVNYRHILNSSNELREYILSGEIKNIEKAAFIAKSSPGIQKILTEACLNGSTLSELKKLSREIPQNNIIKKKTTALVKINFGYTENTKVVKTIIDTVLAHKSFQHLKDKFDNVIWDDHKSIANGFRQLVKLLEQT